MTLKQGLLFWLFQGGQLRFRFGSSYGTDFDDSEIASPAKAACSPVAAEASESSAVQPAEARLRTLRVYELVLRNSCNLYTPQNDILRSHSSPASTILNAE